MSRRAAGRRAAPSGGQNSSSQIALVRLALAHARRVAEGGEVERVFLEGQHRQLAGGAVELLAVAIDHEDARTAVGVDEGAALGDDGDRLGRVARVVDEEADQLAIGVRGS